MSRPCNHRAAGLRRNGKLVRTKRVHRDLITMRRLPLIRTGTVIPVLAHVSPTLHRSRGQRTTVYSSGILRYPRDRRGNVIDNPMPPPRRASMLVQIEHCDRKAFGTRWGSSPL